MAKNKHLSSCPIGGALDVFTGRWKPEILWHLKDKCVRFNQLQRAIGKVSQKMLTQQLRELERDGLVKRTQYPEIPPRVEYECTDLANSLADIFGALVIWGDDHDAEITKARRKYDRHQK
ncbi:MAG: helix-turn-helix transcriptional regulator [Robiginitomaculum sp.]|nr:helix-turn-helix transcriptional regulator [Robiginitomaculum sp.]